MKTYKQARRQLGEQLLYYGMLQTKHQKIFKTDRAFKLF